ncbi:MAG: hypothetical protein Harvfovirus35_14 [Harvfovirus sp.]|uniref:Uncharacterized protein n=1 Tax=Harvfovirus sp. TaxID=2487768 RepID=A0A3G5A2P2_9VIRU|nr:MAG: hypothetical protein Harvfovirus35_14 [Harvfovirus sp.]
MNFKPIIIGLTVIFVFLDGIHFLVGIAASSETHFYRKYYHPTWIMNVLTTVVAMFATGVGCYTLYKNYKNNWNMKKKRAYDIFNVIAAILIFIGLISAGNTHWSEMSHMYFNFTAALYVLKFFLSASLLGARYYYLNYNVTPTPVISSPAIPPAPVASGAVV